MAIMELFSGKLRISGSANWLYISLEKGKRIMKTKKTNMRDFDNLIFNS